MFLKNSMIQEVHIFNKVFCYLLVLIALMICRESYFILFVNFFLLLITKQYRNIFSFHLFVILMNILGIFFPQFLWITKLEILIIYTILLKKVTKTVELRYLLEATLYRFQSKKITYRILYLIYFGKYFRKNGEILYDLKKEYGFSNRGYLFNILQKAYHKTKIQMKDFLVVNQLRFYNDSKRRTDIEKRKWEPWDSNYLMIHLILFCFVFVYGR